MDKIGVKDHSVSGQMFDLIYDEHYEMYRTFPKPSASELPSFYESEDYISHTDANISLRDKTYRLVKKGMLRWKVKLISEYNAPGKLLDIGAGTGDFLRAAKNRGWEVQGVEPNRKAVALAKAKGLDLRNSINEIEEKFDVITLWHVLEHVYDLQNHISFLNSSLSENGTLYIAVPNYRSFDAEKYKQFWAAYDVPRHLYHFSKTSIQKLFEEKGMELVAVKPLIFDSFYVSLLSENYKTDSYHYLRALWSGLRSNLCAGRTGEYSSHIYVLNQAKNRNKQL